MKLFSAEDFSEVNENTQQRENDIVDITADIEEYASDLEIATERLTIASNELNLVGGISASLNSKKLASVDYFTSMENYRPVIEAIADNLGVKNKVPSLEDFKNPYGTEASHQIAMEGFFDYIKKIWEKIKDIFVAFFKKISVFFKRLFNAELDLETYEEYLEGMVAKIKAKKMTISDNKVLLDSKLPSLLANEGMESVNSDFILSVGETKIRHLVGVTNTVFQDNLTKVSKDDLKELHSKLKDVVNEGLDPNKTVDEIALDLDNLKALSISSLNQLFSHQIRDIRELPDTVYDAIFYHFDKTEIDDLLVSSLVDNTRHGDTLPKNFNAYYILSDSGKLFISSSTESNGYTQNKLYPISNANNLVKFYEFYKKFSKELNMKRIDSTIGDFQDTVEDIIQLMRTKFVDLLERLQKSKNYSKLVDKVTTKEMALDTLIGFFVEADKRFPNDPKVNRALFNMASLLKIDGSALENLVRDRDVEASRQLILDSITDEDEFIAETKKQTGAVNSATGNSFSREEMEAILKEYEDLQKFLLNYLNSLQVMLKEVSINLAGTYTQLRFELAKYIYNSAKLYVA